MKWRVLGSHFRAEKGKDKKRTFWLALDISADHNLKNKRKTETQMPVLRCPRNLGIGYAFSDQSEQHVCPT